MSDPQDMAMIDQVLANCNAAIDEIRGRITWDLAAGADPVKVWGSVVVQFHRAYGLGDEHRAASMAFASAVFPDGWWSPPVRWMADE